jgi:hypothetical protein
VADAASVGTNVLIRILLKFLRALFAAKQILAAAMLQSGGGPGGIDLHPANRIVESLGLANLQDWKPGRTGRGVLWIVHRAVLRMIVSGNPVKLRRVAQLYHSSGFDLMATAFADSAASARSNDSAENSCAAFHHVPI